MRRKDLAASRIRYGYRRLRVLLRREGWMVNHKRVHRLYAEEGVVDPHQAAEAQAGLALPAGASRGGRAE